MKVSGFSVSARYPIPKTQIDLEALEKLFTIGIGALGNFDHVLLAYNLAQNHSLLGRATLLSQGDILASLLTAWCDPVIKGRGLFIWRGALMSYFRATSKGAEFLQLREFLERTLEYLRSRKHAPDWLHAVLAHPELLAENPARPLAQPWVDGERTNIEKLKSILEIPESSWFWSDFVTAVVDVCCEPASDALFDGRKDNALDLAGMFPDQSASILVCVVNRSAQCKSTPRYDRLLALVLDAWGSPQLGFSGNKHKWSDASSKAVEMVCSWLAEEDLEDFRLYCRGDDSVDDRRLAYWLRFKKQISFSKLILGRRSGMLGTSVRASLSQESVAALLNSRPRAMRWCSGSQLVVCGVQRKGKACCPYREGCGYEFDFSLPPTVKESSVRRVLLRQVEAGE